MACGVVWKSQICPSLLPTYCIASICHLLPADNICKLFYPKGGLWRQVSHFTNQNQRTLGVIKVWKQPTMGTMKYLSLSAVGIMSQREGIHMQKIKLVITLTTVSVKIYLWSVIHDNPLTLAFTLLFSNISFSNFCSSGKLISHPFLSFSICKMGGNAYLVQKHTAKINN